MDDVLFHIDSEDQKKYPYFLIILGAERWNNIPSTFFRYYAKRFYCWCASFIVVFTGGRNEAINLGIIGPHILALKR